MKKILTPALILATLSQTIYSFCGFYVAGADAELFNEASQVILTREGNSTSITMASDFKGNVNEFATVIPVPEVLTEDQIKVIPQELLDHIDKYSAPRLVEYQDYDPCYPILEFDMTGGLTNFKTLDDEVTIEAQYTVGEFDITILSSTESNALESWLNSNGYKIPPGATDVLGSYIKQGMKFFVAKVNVEELKKLGVNSLRPLQVNFNSEKFMLPLRLGTVNSQGLQELLIYAISSKGRVEALNYQNVELPTGLDLPSFVAEDFGPFYKSMFYNLAAKYNHQAVFTEYFWNMRTCDPCATNIIPDTSLVKLGVNWIDPNDVKGGTPVYITRMHVRYNAQSFPEDITFQETGNTQFYQARYILRHPWKGEPECPEAITYLDEREAALAAEMQNLSKITGWDIETQIIPRIENNIPIPVNKPQSAAIVYIPNSDEILSVHRIDGSRIEVQGNNFKEWAQTQNLKAGIYFALYRDGKSRKFVISKP